MWSDPSLPLGGMCTVCTGAVKTTRVEEEAQNPASMDVSPGEPAADGEGEQGGKGARKGDGAGNGGTSAGAQSETQSANAKRLEVLIGAMPDNPRLDEVDEEEAQRLEMPLMISIEHCKTNQEKKLTLLGFLITAIRALGITENTTAIAFDLMQRHEPEALASMVYRRFDLTMALPETITRVDSGTAAMEEQAADSARELMTAGKELPRASDSARSRSARDSQTQTMDSISVQGAGAAPSTRSAPAAVSAPSAASRSATASVMGTGDAPTGSDPQQWAEYLGLERLLRPVQNIPFMTLDDYKYDGSIAALKRFGTRPRGQGRRSGCGSPVMPVTALRGQRQVSTRGVIT